MQSRLVLLLLFMAFSGLQLMAQNEKKINWMTFEEAVEKSKTDKKPIFIDVYTDWCRYCKEMDQKTFSNNVIAEYMNATFHNVKLNGEQKEDIEFGGTTYKYVQNGGRGFHELAAALLNGKLSYPTVVFLDENFNMLQPLPGFRTPEAFDPIIRYLGGELYKTVKWADFQKSYVSPF